MIKILTLTLLIILWNLSMRRRLSWHCAGKFIRTCRKRRAIKDHLFPKSSAPSAMHFTSFSHPYYFQSECQWHTIEHDHQCSYVHWWSFTHIIMFCAYMCTCAHLILWFREPSVFYNILTLCFVVLPFVGVFKNLSTHILWGFAVFHLCPFMKSLLLIPKHASCVSH